MDWVHDIARGVLRFGVNQSFAIARSHYENIDLATMSQGFTPSFSDAELEDIEKEVAPLAHDLSTQKISKLDKQSGGLVINEQVLVLLFWSNKLWGTFFFLCYKKVTAFQPFFVVKATKLKAWANEPRSRW